jgi:hypothetical protein
MHIEMENKLLMKEIIKKNRSFMNILRKFYNNSHLEKLKVLFLISETILGNKKDFSMFIT